MSGANVRVLEQLMVCWLLWTASGNEVRGTAQVKYQTWAVDNKKMFWSQGTEEHGGRVGPNREQERKQFLRKGRTPPPPPTLRPPPKGWALLPPSTYLNLTVKPSWTSLSQALESVWLRGSLANGGMCINFDDQPWDKEQFYLSNGCRVLFCLLFCLSFCSLVQGKEKGGK